MMYKLDFLKKFIASSLFLGLLIAPNKSYPDFFRFLQPYSAGPEINFPYQNCDEENQKYSYLLSSHFQSIDIRIPALGVNFLPNSFLLTVIPTIPKQCFLAIAIRGNRLFEESQYSSCMDENLVSERRPRKLCINEDYIEMLQQAFTKISYCFDYDLKKQKKILQMINQESGAVLNVQSRTGAKCLGQITEDHVDYLNNIIASSQSNPLPYSEIYDEVVNRCPDLQNKLFKSSDKMLCNSIRDPYKCLFYTFFGFELSLRKVRDKLNARTDRINEDRLSALDSSIIPSYHLPIKRNEMMNVTLSSDEGEKFFTFWDDLEVYETFKNYNNNQNSFLSIEKVPLFKNQENIEFMFAFWAHNGGLSISDRYMISMVENLKQNISRDCNKWASPESKNCLLRRRIQDKQGISDEEVLELFEEELLRNYPSTNRERREEVAYYLQNMRRSNKTTFGYDEDTSNEMLNYYEEAIRFNADHIQMEREEAIEFQKFVAETCIDNIFLDF